MKNKGRKITVVLLFVAMFFVLVVGIIFWDRKSKPQQDVFPQTIKEVVSLRSEWKKKMRVEGSESFYLKLKDVYTTNAIQHAVAHVFGELLYENDGLKGVSVCDDSFFYGCYHSFMAKAVAENGLEVLKEINYHCLEKFGGRETGCQHGLGHAVMQYRQLDSLETALADCELFEIGKGGCKTGVFMEFNLPIVEGAGGVDVSVREITNEDYYYPCFSVSKDSRSECISELPRWWMRLKEENVAEVGKLCSGLPTEYRSFCFEAVGQQIDLYEIKVIRNGCSQMPDSGARASCLIGASWGVFTWPGRIAESRIVCDGLSDKEKEECPSTIEIEQGYKKR